MVVFDTVFEDVAGEIDGGAERLLAGAVLAGDVVAGAVGGAGADVGQAGGVVDALGEGHQLEGDETLVVVEGQDAVELVEFAAAEEAVAGEGTIGEDAVGLGLVDDGTDDLEVEVADDAVVAGMGVEGEDGDFGDGDAEVALEALVHEGDFLEQQVVGERVGDILEGEVVGDDADADAVADHEHEAGASELVGEILGVAGEVEIVGLDVALVDGGGDEDVDGAGLEVGAGAVEALARETAGDVGALAKVDFHLLLGEVDDVELAVLRLGGIADGGEGHLAGHGGEEFLMIGGHLGGAVEDGGADVVHTAVAEGFEDDLVAHTVDVAVGDSDFDFLFLMFMFHRMCCVYCVKALL